MHLTIGWGLARLKVQEDFQNLPFELHINFKTSYIYIFGPYFFDTQTLNAKLIKKLGNVDIDIDIKKYILNII